MVIQKSSINSFLIYSIAFFSFLGFYALILVLINAGMSGMTRVVTIPIRLLIGLCLIGLLTLNFRKARISTETYWFLLFAAFYLCRIIIDYYLGEPYYLSTVELLFYFTSFAIIPFLSVSTFNLTEKTINVLIKGLTVSGFFFSILAFVFYSQFIGQVSRLSSSTANADVVSPLILSYCSTLIIGVFLSYLIHNKVNFLTRVVMIVAVFLSIIPFFLGASRGSLIALLIPFVLMAVARMSFIGIIKNIFFLLILLSALAYLDAYLESGLLNRFLGISEDIEEGSTSSLRLIIWDSAFDQFLNYPIIGDKLRVDNWTGYAHNLFIETLQTTGILGFIPFSLVVFKALFLCVINFKIEKKFSWIFVIFLQAFFQNMFSGALYTAAWFWTSLALVYAADRYLQFRKTSNNVNVL